jgi:hypothetical protein
VLALQRQRLAKVPFVHVPLAQNGDLLKHLGQRSRTVATGSRFQPLDRSRTVSSRALCIELRQQDRPLGSRKLGFDRRQRLLLDLRKGLARKVTQGALGGQQDPLLKEPLGSSANEFVDRARIRGCECQHLAQLCLRLRVELANAGVSTSPKLVFVQSGAALVDRLQRRNGRSSRTDSHPDAAQ